jgi:hypothetical protein
MVITDVSGMVLVMTSARSQYSAPQEEPLIPRTKTSAGRKPCTIVFLDRIIISISFFLWVYERY